MRESQIAQKVIDTEYFMFGIYAQKTYHKLRNLSSWGIDLLEIFMTKVQKNVPYKALGYRG